MFSKILANFLHYYETRGKAELQSFAATFMSAFGVFFVAVAYTDLIQLTQGVFTVEILTAIGLAAVRSGFAAVLYAIWPNSFPIRSPKV